MLWPAFNMLPTIPLNLFSPTVQIMVLSCVPLADFWRNNTTLVMQLALAKNCPCHIIHKYLFWAQSEDGSAHTNMYSFH